MTGNREIRRTARQLLGEGRSGIRAWIAAFGLGLVAAAALMTLQYVFARFEVQTFGDFLRMRLKAAEAGLLLEPPSAAAARQMFTASSFQSFVELLVQGLCAFGLAVMALRIVRRVRGSLATGAFRGFADPFSMLWITLVLTVRVLLWALLFVLPGLVAYLRYGLVWMLRADHPDWGVGRCIAESSRLMAGCKLQLLRLKLYYLLELMGIVLVGNLLVLLLPQGAAAVLLVLPPVMFGAVVYVLVELNVAHGVFYLARLKDQEFYVERETEVSAAGQDCP